MKFCDKLAKLRKNNNLSQEQLADRLGVSRQAVSKWESGTSHPDMEKIIEICKILNCTLDELMDDDIIGENYKNLTSSDKKNYFKDFLNFVTRTYNMFCTMKFTEKIKCIFEMIMIIVILAMIGSVVIFVLNSLTFKLLAIMPYEIRYNITNIIGSFYLIIIIMISAVITFHLFKIRYLDYYITIEDQNVKEKTIERPIEQETVRPEEKEKIIIRDPKHSSYSFVSIIAKIIGIMAKIFSGLIIFLLTIIFIFIVMLTVIVVYHLNSGEIFTFLTLIGTGIILLLLIGIRILYNFIFERKIKHKILFPIFIVSLAIIGIGSGLTLTCFARYSKIDDFEDIEKYEYTETITLENTFDIYSTFHTEFKIDNSLDNEAKIVISAPKGIECQIYVSNSIETSYYSIHMKDIDYSKFYNIIMEDLKNKKYRNYNNLRNYIDVTIYINENNYNKLINRYYY